MIHFDNSIVILKNYIEYINMKSTPVDKFIFNE